MTAHGGSNGAPLGDGADDEDPRVQRVYARLRRLTMVGGLTMGVGFLALISVIVYRVVKSTPAPTTFVERALALPEGARVVSTAADAGRILVTIERDGRVSVHVVDAATLAETGRLDLAPGVPSAPPLR
ncbi:hypothetical protein JOD31_001559 [Methylopila capsulata]|uniref:Uncharacterized protein n=1 Tax=Methylopila capsulata TaxID=61654 RepID=A0A9W6IQ02_9HYPH|nr:DUF6476 family protein [Methylopila capsulata]MBM7851334.1 hypothetical protein [Methylopila capsulata]GLK54392.1 hypothetical protein GCM10008170_04110 [Methylopila capsulata]